MYFVPFFFLLRQPGEATTTRLVFDLVQWYCPGFRIQRISSE